MVIGTVYNLGVGVADAYGATLGIVQMVLETVLLARFYLREGVPPRTCLLIALHGICRLVLPIAEVADDVGMIVAAALAVTVFQHQGDGMLVYVVDALACASRHSGMLHFIIGGALLVLHSAEEVGRLSGAIGIAHHHAYLVYHLGV